MNHSILADTAHSIVADGKGILAADESTPTIKKRFDSIQAESSESSRNKYRDMLFTSPEAGNYISGVILYEETLFQSTISNAVSFPNYLIEKGVIPGIKVDTGAKNFALHKEEKITEGLDGQIQ